MKKIKYTTFASLLLLGVLTSCTKDDLDLKPISSTYEEEFYKTDNDILGLVLGVYDGLQAIPKREFTLTEMRSDNAISRIHEGEYQQLETFNVDPTNSVSAGYYTANYNVIFRANTVLAHIDVMKDAAKKVNYIAEAKFSRALAYFNLVRAYGEVPLIDKLVTPAETAYFAKKPVADIYALIEADFTAAIAGLPLRTATTFGRATKGAAQGLLAKVYLTQFKYSAALPLLTTLINDTSSNKYALQTLSPPTLEAYKSVFYTEGNNEILFAIPYVNDSRFESQDFSIEMTISGNALDYATANLRTFLTANSTTDLRFTTNLLTTVPATSTSYGQNNKFTKNSIVAAQAGNDWIVLRMADVLLLYVEAVMGTAASTNDASAIAAYDKVRNRSFVTPVVSTSITKTMLLDQRRVEFAFENQRLYDLIRFGVANTVLSAYSNTFTATKDLLLPLPQSEINSSKGLLVQNPLY
ncbi:RagB/SusD family nutrient uptake outer membrane protein [Flavobacterium sp. WC2509]|uniref:RagB/SusD family nutrient uptake outer membrane protein n=1 Tax=Flavobacterium sp. WC2509 TaxID=3461406 RepID=UPI00404415DB